jgi:anti-sigma regulatory factor (Ser/Thr protein kinase)
VKIDRSFAPDAASIRAARRFVLDAVASAPPDVRDAISVMVSELAMNAVQYAHTDFDVSMELTEDSLRVEVTDSGGGTPAVQPRPPASSLHGRGLFLVDRLSDEWGVSPSRDGPHTGVWFRVAMRGAQGKGAQGRGAQGIRS